MFLAKQDKDEQLVNHINDSLIDLRNVVIREEFPENENPRKKINVVEESSILKTNSIFYIEQKMI